MFLASTNKTICMNKNFFLSAGFLFTLLCNINAQPIKVSLAPENWDTVMIDRFDSIRVKLTRETYLGKECIRLQSGSIIMKGVELRDGSIEADISFPRERGFPGFSVRMQDINNYENFYVRPHQSGNPDATQYTPEFNGQTGFQLYYGDGYNGPINYKFNEWNHIKIELHGLQAEFYINDTLVVKVKELLTGWKSGKIAIGTNSVPLRIANIQYTIKDVSPPVPIPVPKNGEGGMVTNWRLSNVIHRSLFEKKYKLTPEIKKQLSWTMQPTEYSGTMNLAKFDGLVTEKGRTMVAKLHIESASEQVKEISFGFSDYVLVYLNDKVLYYGADAQNSRDYRFLGTIGYFDKLFLPLKKGMNELWFVVSEDFGGWGLKAKFEDMEGILLK